MLLLFTMDTSTTAVFLVLCSLSLCFCALADSRDITELEIRMPNISVPEDDIYFCTSKRVSSDHPLWIVGVRLATENAGNLHHLSVGVCEDAEDGLWECKPGQRHNACKRGARNVWSWNDRHTDTRYWDLPQGAGIGVGAGTRYKFVVIQVHYAHGMAGTEIDDSGAVLQVTETEQLYSTMTLVTGNTGFIPPQVNGFPSEAACEWRGPPAEIVRYKVHTHEHGVLVEGFLVRNGSFIRLGRMSPAKSQAYLDVDGNQPIAVKPGDHVAARCYYKNPGSKPINFGARHEDEMCNLYILARYETTPISTVVDTQTCTQDAQIYRLYDRWSNAPPPQL